MSEKLARGVIHGRMIELNQDLGLNEGEEVEVRVTIFPKGEAWGEGILRSAGAWVGYPELDAVMEQIQQERQRERRPQGLE